MAGAALQKYLCAEDGLAAAVAGGYSHWYVDGSLEGERPRDWSVQRIATLRECVAATGVLPIYHGNFKAPIGSDVAEIRRSVLGYVREEIDLCAQLGAPLILHGGGLVEPRAIKVVKRLALDGLVESLNTLAAYAHERGVPLWLENLSNYTTNHPFYYVFTKDNEYEYVLSRVEGVEFILDVSHAYINDGDPVAVFRRFHDRIVAMAFSDNKAVVDSHLPLGEGSLDFRTLVEAISEIGWRGVISFETRGSDLDHSLGYLRALEAALPAAPRRQRS